MSEWKVSRDEEGEKLVSFLRSKLGEAYSARHIKRLIENNRCQLNGQTERFASKLLRRGDRVVFEGMAESSYQASSHVIEPSRLLFEDEDLLIYNKPAGISCDDKGILLLLHSRWPSVLLVHRLDKDTTGVLILAKHASAYEAMAALFRERQVVKVYWALVDGVPDRPSGVITNRLAKVGGTGGQPIWGSGRGEMACTEWRCKKKGGGIALLVCFPKTGRTHQIRVHLSEMGHPILGDYHYCRFFRSPYRPLRPLLHAQAVGFVHPRTGEKIKIEAPLPKDFLEYMEKLE